MTYFECKQCISRAIPLRRSKANSVDSDQHHCAVVCQLTIDLWQTMKFLIRKTGLSVFLYTSVTPLFWRGLTEHRRKQRYRYHARTLIFTTGTCVFSHLDFILKLVEIVSKSSFSIVCRMAPMLALLGGVLITLLSGHIHTSQ